MIDPATTSFVAQRKRFQPLRVAVIALVVAGAVLLAANWHHIRNRLVPRNLGTVEAGFLYRSGQIHSELLPGVLKDKQIDKVISLTFDPGKPDWEAEPKICADLGIEHLQTRGLIGNGTGDLEQYVIALEALKTARDAGQQVLIHCAAGAQRTGAAIYFWRTLVEGKPPAAAKQEMLRFGHDPGDNADLIPFINQNMGELAGRLVERGVIAEVPDPLPRVP